MKKLICMIPTAGKTMEQIKAEAIEAFKAAGFFKEAVPVPQKDLSNDEVVVVEKVHNCQPTNPVFLKVWEKLTENRELEGLSDEETLEKVVSVTEKLLGIKKS